MKKIYKALVFVPLLAMGAGVWYYIQHRVQGAEGPSAQSGPVFGGAAKPAPAAGTAAVVDQALSGTAAVRQDEAYDPKAPGLDIQGPARFQEQVTQALKLVWAADRDTFLMIRNSLQVVRAESRTGYYAEEGRAVAALSDAHAFRSLTWCAGVIAHQAWHASYAASKRRRARAGRGVPLPGEASRLVVEANPAKVDYAGMDAVLYVEDKAASFQLDVLRKVGAPRRETDPVFRRAPRDFQLAHDGNYVIKP